MKQSVVCGSEQLTTGLQVSRYRKCLVFNSIGVNQ